jgi:GalNAc-alpha-(1->4)-GalNAc-alpha-(1->3)-diNAcBac-PP-undecaprenol alpha-1,4-N-acetyl-D-galactosaminyltransferase
MGRRLTLVVPSLGFGGAQRVVAQMAGHWAARGDAVTVITLSGADCDAFPLAAAVQRIALDLTADSHGPIEAITHNISRVRRLRQAIKTSACETLISFTDRTNVLALLACRPLGVDTVIAERSNPSKNETSRAWNWLRRRTYPSARALVVQTERVRREMATVMRGGPIYVIPNAVEIPTDFDPPAAAGSVGGPKWIIAAGRLSREKGYDLLIDAFSRVASRHPNWSLKILGEGPARAELEELIRSRGLSGRVLLPGWENQPTSEFRRADLFVLPSRYEGFPNALLEAMAAGLPAISFDCDFGPAEIIRDGTDGILVPSENVAALAEAIERAIGDEALRQRLGSEAARVVDRFSEARYFERWDAVLRREPPPVH